MICETCGAKTRINWGNSLNVRCELHSSNLTKPTPTSGKSTNIVNKPPTIDKKTITIIQITVVIIELLLLPLWYIVVILALAGAGSASWLYWFIAGPTIAYPFLIIVTFIAGRLLLKAEKYEYSIIIMFVPLVISFGPIFSGRSF